MGIINVNIDSGLQSEPFYPSASILEISTRYNETPYFQKIKREPLVFNLTIAFEDGFDDDKLRETARWLNQKTFKELYFSNQPDKKYFAIYEGSPRLFHTGADGYFEITFRTNSPYAHSNLIETGIYNQVSPTFTFTRPSPAIHPETGAEVGVDEPIFMPFSGDGATAKQGLLCEEGTENYFTNSIFVDADSDGKPDGWSSVGTVYDIKEIIETEKGMAFHIRRESGVGDFFLSQTKTFEPGKTYTLAIDVFDIANSGALPKTGYYMGPWGLSGYDHIAKQHKTNLYASRQDFINLGGGWWRAFVTFTIDEDSGGSAAVGLSTLAIGREFYFIYPQIEENPYPTSFTSGARAPSSTSLTLPEALPNEFGIGIAAKMEQDSGAKTRTFWQAGDYHRLHYDTADSKLKMQFGEVTAEQEADWSAGDIIGVYAGRQDGKLFLQSKIAGVLGDGVESEKWRRNLLINSGNERVVGLSWTDYNLFPEIQQVLGKTVTFSIEAKTSNGADTFDFYPRPASGYAPIKSFAPTTEYEKYYFTFTYLDDDTATVLRVRHNTAQNPNNDGVLYIRNVKLELGDITTPWTPAPEDGDSKDIHIGSNSDSEETVNAVLADFVLHDSGDIDPEGYLAGVPGGGE